MTTRDELVTRLAAVERRLADHAARPLPPGLTEPDPEATERWEAGQVWAHLAEFPAYWLGQVNHILDSKAAAAVEPIPFGRTTTDPGRLAAIERDRNTDRAALLERIRAGTAGVLEAVSSLGADAWAVRGLHPMRGEMPVGVILERFVVSHLEEHADQLDALRRGQP